MLVFDVKLIRDFGHCEDNIGAKFGFRRSCIVSHVDYFSRYERISTYLEPGTGYAWVTCSINSQTAVRVVCVCQRQSFSFTQVSKSIFGLTVSLLLRAKNNISLCVCMFCRYEEMLANPAKHVLAIAKVRIEEQSANQDCMRVHAHVGRSECVPILYGRNFYFTYKIRVLMSQPSSAYKLTWMCIRTHLQHLGIRASPKVCEAIAERARLPHTVASIGFCCGFVEQG